MKRMTNRRARRGLCALGLAGIAAAGAAVLPTVTASAATTQTPVNFELNITPGGAQVGFMYGKQLGIFAKNGINLTITPGSGSVTTSELVASGKVDIGYSDPAAAFAVAAKGGNVVVITPILQANGYAVLSLAKNNITSVADLKGKSVGIAPGTAETQLFPAVLGNSGLSTKSIDLQNLADAAVVGALRVGKVDAIASAGDQEGPSMKVDGVKLNEQFFYQNGAPTVGESIIVNKQFLQSNASLVRSFVNASLQSWVATKKNPKAAAAAEVKQFPTAGSVAQILAQTKVDVGLLCAAKGSTTMGEVPAPVWNKEQTLLQKYNGLPKSYKVSKGYTTAYQPSNAPSCS